MKLFIIAPINDDTTAKITAIWARELEEFAKSIGINTISLIGENVTKMRLETILRVNRNREGIFCFLDHSNEELMSGSDGKVLLDKHNIELLKNKFIYSISCKSGICLSHIAIKKGVLGFLGFDDIVKVVKIGEFPALLGEALIMGIVEMLENRINAIKAKEIIIEKLNEKVDYIRQTYGVNEEILNTFYHNRDSLVLIGNENWKWN